jgi:hypothetical protein
MDFSPTTRDETYAYVEADVNECPIGVADGRRSAEIFSM